MGRTKARQADSRGQAGRARARLAGSRGQMGRAGAWWAGQEPGGQGRGQAGRAGARLTGSRGQAGTSAEAQKGVRWQLGAPGSRAGSPQVCVWPRLILISP